MSRYYDRDVLRRAHQLSNERARKGLHGDWIGCHHQAYRERVRTPLEKAIQREWSSFRPEPAPPPAPVEPPRAFGPPAPNSFGVRHAWVEGGRLVRSCSCVNECATSFYRDQAIGALEWHELLSRRGDVDEDRADHHRRAFAIRFAIAEYDLARETSTPAPSPTASELGAQVEGEGSSGNHIDEVRAALRANETPEGGR